MADEAPGGSASERAASLRQRAAMLEEEAANWEKGAEGERRTSAELHRLAPKGYSVFDDRAIPASKANLDHIVIGPTGVFVIDSKSYTGRLQIAKGTLWHGRYPLRRELDTLLWEAELVRKVVSTSNGARAVHAVVCIHDTPVPVDTHGELGAIQVCGPSRMRSLIEDGNPVLGPEEVAAIAAAVDTAFPPKGDPLRPTIDTSASSPSSPQTSATRISKQLRSNAHGRTAAQRARPRRSRELLGAVLAMIAALGLLIVLIAGIRIAVDNIRNPSAGTPGSPLPVSDAHVTWSCPAPGQGWTSTLQWTPSPSNVTGYEAEWSETPTGPFRPGVVFGPGAVVQHVPAGSSGAYRIRAVRTVGVQTYRSGDVRGDAAAPTEPC